MLKMLILFPVNLELIKNLWLPNIFIYNLKSFKTIDVLSKLAGLWIDSKKRIYYSQATHITFICPMVFDSFPLDTQQCKFQVWPCLASYHPNHQYCLGWKLLLWHDQNGVWCFYTGLYSEHTVYHFGLRYRN